MPQRDQFSTEAEWLAHLRLWFAGQALTLLNERALKALVEVSREEGLKSSAGIAGFTYQVADAMLKERARGEA